MILKILLGWKAWFMIWIWTYRVRGNIMALQRLGRFIKIWLKWRADFFEALTIEISAGIEEAERKMEESKSE